MASWINTRAADSLRAALRRRGIVATDAYIHPSIVGPKLYKQNREGNIGFCLIELHTHEPGIFVVRRAGKRGSERFRGLHNAARRAVDLYLACRKK